MTLTVQDGGENGALPDAQIFTITVTPVNQAPTITSIAPLTATEGSEYAYTATVTDVDDDNNGTDLTWSLTNAPAGMTVTSTGKVTWTPSGGVATSGAVTLSVEDGKEDGALPDSQTFTITVTDANQTPTITSTAPVTATEGNEYSYIATVEDVDDANNGTDLTWSLTNAPAGMTVTSTGKVTWTPGDGVTTSGEVTLTVEDGKEDGALPDSQIFTITVTPVNQAPTITSTAPSTAVEDVEYTYTATVTDVDDINNGTDLTWGLTNAPTGMTVSSIGKVTWTPANGVSSSGVVTLTVEDGKEDGALPDSQTFTISVTAENDAPIATDDDVTLDEDSLVIIDILDNDSDDENQLNTAGVSILVAPEHGTLSVNPSTGEVTYTPEANFHGKDSFSYQVTDSHNVQSNNATVTITVNSLNDAPIANNDAFSTAEDTAISLVSLIANDSDADGSLDAASVTITKAASHALRVSIVDGKLNYTPAANYVGNDTLEYTVLDNDGLVSAAATITITVIGENDAPVAVNDSAITDEDNAVVIDVVNNDTDIEDISPDSTTVTITTAAEHGEVVVDAITGEVTYTPADDYNGSDSFAYSVNDFGQPVISSNVAQVTITINAVNDAPEASDDSIVLFEDEKISLNVLGNDSDLDGQLALDSVVVTSQPEQGSVAVDPVTGWIDYTPSLNFAGETSFTYTVNDNLGLSSNEATVTLQLSPLNDAPEAEGQSLVTVEDIALDITLTGTDVDNDNLTYTLVIAPQNGSLSGTGENLTYTPNADYNGSDSFTFKVFDGVIDSTVAIVNIEVTPVNDPPKALPQSLETAEDMPLAIILTGEDAENDILTYTIVSTPDNGQLTGTAPNLVYTPSADFNGNDSFIFRVNDSLQDSVLATVSIVVNPLNDAPVAVDDSYIVDEGASLTVGIMTALTSNDSDIDSAFTALLVTQPSNGSVTLNNDGSFTYHHDGSETTSDSFTYKINDGELDSNIATVTFSVTPVNDPAVISGGATGTSSGDSGETTSGALMVEDDDANEAIFTEQQNTAGEHGQFSVDANGDWQYVINEDNSAIVALTDGETLTETFVVTSIDGTEMLVTITITGVNDAPVALDDFVTVDEDSAINVVVLANDSDLDSAEISVVSASTSQGTVTIFDDGQLVFTPEADFYGEAIIDYIITDGSSMASAQVFITVLAVNDAPLAVNDIAVTYMNIPVTLSHLENDSDIDSDDLTTIDFTVLSGAAEVTAEGVLLFTPETDFIGSAYIHYTISDGDLTATATVEIIVSTGANKGAINQPPIANDDEVTLSDWLQTSISVLDNDSDPDGDEITLISASAVLGEVTVNENQLLYTPVSGMTEFVIVEYVIIDSEGALAQAQVKINFTIEQAELLPELSVPDDLCADLTVQANALYTRVELGIASAADRFGNQLPVSILDGVSLFPPGLNTTYWQTVDAEGNTAIAPQQICVQPLVSIAKDQVVVEGEAVQVGVYLNGAAPSYPVIVPYTVSGSAEQDDYSLLSGEVIITEGSRANIDLTTILDGVDETDETLIITLSDELNRGAKYQHQITISQGNLAPEVELAVLQDNQQRLIVSQHSGLVTVDADIYDPNLGDTFSFDWSTDADNMVNQSSESDKFIFDPSELAVGIYHVTLVATDRAIEAKFDIADVYLQLVEQLDILSNKDLDGDNIADNIEGHQDLDGDGIVDYADRISECNVIPEYSHVENGFLIEANPGVCLRRGEITLGGRTGAAHITDADATAELNGLAIDNAAVNIGGIFDFIGYGLPQSQQALSIVIPQRKPVPENAVYRKYAVTEGWLDFVENNSNSLWSTQGEPGYCPPPQSDLWQAGLTPGAWCVQLMITDGGVNDNDGYRNATVVGTGYVGVLADGNQPPIADNLQLLLPLNGTTNINIFDLVSDPDGDTLSLTSATPIFGTVSVVDEQIIYQALEGYAGTDIIRYGVSDGKGGTAYGEITINFIINRAPVIADITMSDMKQGAEAEPINIIAVTTDADDDALELISATALNGSVSFDADGNLIYLPNDSFSGTDTITVAVRDAYGHITMATFTVEVIARTEVSSVTKSSGGAFSWLLMLAIMFIAYRRLSLTTMRHLALAGLVFISIFNQNLAVASSSTCGSAVSVDCSPYNGWYIGGQLGQAQTDVSQQEIDDAFNEVGIIASSVSVDDSDMSYGVFGGYQFNQYFALQLGYLDLGEREVRFTGEAHELPDFYDAAEHIYPDTGKGFNLSAIVSYPLTERWKLSGKAGLFDWQRDYDTFTNNDDVGSDDISGTDLMLGIEAGYHFRRDLQFFASYETITLKNHDVDQFSLGIRYFFGQSTPKAIPALPKKALPVIAKVAPVIVEPVVTEPEIVEPEVMQLVKAPEPISIYFALDKFNIDAQSHKKVKQAQNILANEPDLIAIMTGYSSTIGLPDWNYQLSNWRVHQVAKLLYLNDVRISRLSTAYQGDVTQDATPKSQRVDIIFVRVPKNLMVAEKTTINFGIFSDKLVAADVDKIKQAVAKVDLEKLNHVSVVAYAKSPGNDAGLKELASSRANKVAELLKSEGIDISITTNFILLKDNEQPQGRKVDIEFHLKE
ncbi:Ig-like domain-containing protein [Thalassotalea sp. ND16A]|uniref:Ig-like domain-containing protein n=1 Tax=Thalassotalea sp. ND16A TaxID=1535422 RepID=UPI000AED808F|nr:Ig-like domain-containing protein [Thalassotalea sp. ND16A]